MKVALYRLENGEWFINPKSTSVERENCQLVLCFAGKRVLGQLQLADQIRERFPAATVCLCSTAGEIHHTEVLDESVAVTAFSFEHTRVVSESVRIGHFGSSFEAGATLARKFTMEELVYVLVLSDGSHVNGSALAAGMNSVFEGRGVVVSGGLAGDGDRFISTLVGLNAAPEEGVIAAVGFYGSKLLVGHGSMGGWETFGLEKKVTRSDHNILYEIDGRNALDLYKRYLGEEAAHLPSSALLFPLSVVLPGTDEFVVRTILSVDEGNGSMTFAGDVPTGARVRFMRANFDKLVTAAADAAANAFFVEKKMPDYALLISCVGRKLILQSRIEEEVDSVAEAFGNGPLLSGFYSYGELSPLTSISGTCHLHNQTMTITTFHEME